MAEGGIFTEGAECLDFLLPIPGSFLYINFLFTFPVSMQIAPFHIPSLLCQYFDSSEKAVYLKLERAIQHCLLFLLLRSV